MSDSGIYKIRNIANSHSYIGSAVNFKNRWRTHLHHLRSKKHHSPYLQRAWDKYGEQHFVFEILECCDKSLLIEREQFYLDSLNPEYNICKIAGSSLGVKRTPEQIENISKSHLGQKAWNKGLPQSEDQKMAHSKRMKGRRSGAKGKKWNSDSRKKLSKSRTGTKLSESTKQKLSKKIISINMETNERVEYKSITYAAQAVGGQISNISSVCLGKRKTAYGFKWEFVQ